MNFPGLLTRQELVDYAKGKADKLLVELVREQTILENESKTMSDSQFETLSFSTQNIIGMISAYRDITEWARDHVLETTPGNNLLNSQCYESCRGSVGPHTHTV